MNDFRPWLLSVAVLVAAPTHGFAQQQTTATYEDWTVRCVASGKPPKKVCDLEQLSHLKGTERPFSRIEISRPAKGQPLRLLVQVPVNVSLATGVRVQVDGRDWGLAGPFRRCLLAGCFATIALKDGVLKTFGATKAPVRIVYANAAKAKVAIPLSLKGFSQAFDALTKE